MRDSIMKFMLDGCYMMRKPNFHLSSIGYQIYSGNQNPVKFCTYAQTKFILNVLKEDSHQRFTLNLSLVRQLDGRNFVKKSYRAAYKKKKQQHMGDIKSRQELYVNECFKYGIITLCYLIEQYAVEENFEECQIILNAIKKVGEMIKEDVPTHYDDNAKAWLKNKLLPITRTDGSNIIDNVYFYAEHIKKELNKK